MMKLRTKYIVFIVFIHLITLVLAFFIFEKNKILFIIAELFVLISLFISWKLYMALIGPLKTLMTGVEAIREQDFTVKFLPTGKYEMDKLIEVFNNMIDQLRIERTKQEQQHFFLEKLIQTSPTGIIILDYDRIIEQVNPRALILLGSEESGLAGKKISESDHPFLKQVSNMNAGDSRTFSLNGIQTFKVQVSSFVDRGFPRLFIMIEEVTAEILATEKKVYEKIIRMMAHEVNNTIGPVNSILQSALKKTVYDEAREDILQSAFQVAVNRNNNLNKFMRNFADLVKLPDPALKPINLSAVIKRVCQLMSLPALEREIELIVDDGAKEFILMADEQQIEQVMLNIIKNAMESIDRKGIIYIRINHDIRSLTITDTGKGISDENTARIFSSFFSTKKDGQGIGLMLVREILMNHGFIFSLKTLAPQQTEFMIRFNA